MNALTYRAGVTTDFRYPPSVLRENPEREVYVSFHMGPKMKLEGWENKVNLWWAQLSEFTLSYNQVEQCQGSTEELEKFFQSLGATRVLQTLLEGSGPVEAGGDEFEWFADGTFLTVSMSTMAGDRSFGAPCTRAQVQGMIDELRREFRDLLFKLYGIKAYSY